MFPPRIYGFQLQIMERSKIIFYVFYIIYTFGIVFFAKMNVSFQRSQNRGPCSYIVFSPSTHLGALTPWPSEAWVIKRTIFGWPWPGFANWLLSLVQWWEFALFFFCCLCLEWNISRGNVVKVGKSWVSLLSLHVVFLDSLLYWLHTCNGTRCTSSKKASA